MGRSCTLDGDSNDTQENHGTEDIRQTTIWQTKAYMVDAVTLHAKQLLAITTRRRAALDKSTWKRKTEEVKARYKRQYLRRRRISVLMATFYIKNYPLHNYAVESVESSRGKIFRNIQNRQAGRYFGIFRIAPTIDKMVYLYTQTILQPDNLSETFQVFVLIKKR